MADPLVDPQMMQRLAVQLEDRDRRERVARRRRAIEAIPAQGRLSGPVPLEFTPTPSSGPGGIGPRQELDPRFGGGPSGPLLQAYAMMGSPWEQARSIERGYASPGAAGSVYPAYEEASAALDEARRAHEQLPGGNREAINTARDAQMAAFRQAAYYADPDHEARREYLRLVGAAKEKEAARQRRLEDTFGTPEDRARQILQLEASLFPGGGR